jgi:hypothetical protein
VIPKFVASTEYLVGILLILILGYELIFVFLFVKNTATVLLELKANPESLPHSTILSSEGWISSTIDGGSIPVISRAASSANPITLIAWALIQFLQDRVKIDIPDQWTQTTPLRSTLDQ